MEMFLDFLMNVLSLLFAFIAIGFCIFSHELGHFLAGKWRGLHIDAFSLGFKAFWKKKINGVEYRLGWLPFGGYVELPQVDATDAVPKAADGTELPRAKPLDRLITAAAGPLFNIISGLLIGCIVWIVGMPQDSPKMREITVLTIDQTGPEYAAGLRENDVIVKLNGEPFFATWTQFVSKILFSIGEVKLEVMRDGKPVTIVYTPKENPNAPGRLRDEKIAYPFFTPLVPLEVFPKKDSIAYKAGIRSGDYLVAINGQPLLDYSEFQSGLDQAGSNPVELTIRDTKGNIRKVTVTPEPIPDLPPHFTRYLTGIMLGTKMNTPGIYVLDVVPNSTAKAAGLKSGDRLVSVNGKKIDAPQVFVGELQTLKTEPFDLVVERDGKMQNFRFAAKLVVPQTIGMDITLRDHPTPFQQLAATVDMSYKSLRGIVIWAGNQLGLTEQTSSLKPTHMSGPLGMGMVLFDSVRQASLISGIYFMVVISFALAIFNLFPLPVLDGGHVMFSLIEMIIRRPVPTIIIKSLSTVFIVLLIALMVFVTFSDGRRLLRRFGVGQTQTEAQK